MEHLVTTLETSKKLKAAGFPQKPHSQNMYVDGVLWDTTMQSDHQTRNTAPESNWIAAPTAQEIADQLPKCHAELDYRYNDYLTVTTDRFGTWAAGYQDIDGGMYEPTAPFDNLVEALAALWLKLQETKS